MLLEIACSTGTNKPTITYKLVLKEFSNRNQNNLYRELLQYSLTTPIFHPIKFILIYIKLTENKLFV